nr:MAG TPA: hypothetical protein [Caudoviricetes sp.]
MGRPDYATCWLKIIPRTCKSRGILYHSHLYNQIFRAFKIKDLKIRENQLSL